MFTLLDLLDWLEALLQHRTEHYGEWFMLFATDERYVELHIVEDEIWTGGVTNRNLSREQWLTDVEAIKMNLFGWELDAAASAEPKFVRRWAASAPTHSVASNVLQVFTSIYLPGDVEVVDVVRGTFAGDNVAWENTL